MVKMFLVNGSVAAMKLMFSGSVRTYIFIFWIVRAVVVEILKGQIMYSFVHFSWCLDILHRHLVHMQSKGTDTEYVVVFVYGLVRVFGFNFTVWTKQTIVDVCECKGNSK